MLDQAAIDAVTQWKYEPTRVDGRPVEVEMNVYINFTLS
jgi:outer membrane biosynthesis protein TonB